MTREVNYFQKEPPGPWAAQAACRGMRVHFPDAPVNSPERARQVAYAKTICGQCPVREPCLELALKNGEQHGVWGAIEFPNGARAYRRRLAKLAVSA